MHGFIKKLQSSDERVKRRWLIGATVVSMAIIIYVWLAYFNNLMAQSAQNFQNGAQANSLAAGGSAQVGESAPVPSSALDNIKQGLGTAYSAFVGGVESVGKMLKTPREYVIDPNQK